MAKKVANKTASKKAAAKSAPKTKKNKFIYLFGAKTDGDATMRNLLGGKGANLAEMARIGLPVRDSQSQRKSATIFTRTVKNTLRHWRPM